MQLLNVYTVQYLMHALMPVQTKQLGAAVTQKQVNLTLKPKMQALPQAVSDCCSQLFGLDWHQYVLSDVLSCFPFSSRRHQFCNFM